MLTNKQSDKEQRTKVSTTESTLILSGYSRELANKLLRTEIEETSTDTEWENFVVLRSYKRAAR